VVIFHLYQMLLKFLHHGFEGFQYVIANSHPNIENLQSHIENLQNRGEEISKAFDKDEK
jgi:hypothetical protein